MKVLSADLKHALKKLAQTRADAYQIGPDGVSAQDTDVQVFVDSPLPLTGTFSTNGKKLTSIINRMSGEIEISQNEKSIVLKSARQKVELETHPTKAIARPKTPEDTFCLTPSEFKKALSLTSNSAATNRAFPYGNVLQLQALPLGVEDTSPSGYRVVGTDASVLSVYTVKEPVPYDFQLLLNLTAAGIVQLMDDSIEIGLIDDRVWLKGDGTTVLTSVTNQKYPVFDSLLNDPGKLVISFKSKDFLSAIRSVEPLIDEAMDQGAIGGHFKDGVVKWSSVGIGSTASDEADYEQVSPDPLFDPKEFKVRSKAKHLTQFLSKAGEDVVMSLTDSKKPIKMTSGVVTMLTMPITGS